MINTSNIMLSGIGVDIEEIERFRQLDFEANRGFLDKIFTEKELDYCFSKKDPAHHLAVRYSAKEAVVKSLNTSNIESLSYKEIEILTNNAGAPFVKITKKYYDKFKFLVSLSHSKTNAIAFVISMEGSNFVEN